ncbi:beta-L-arabinobiosidase [Calothrix sp. NIES-2100]|uniref:hypothetical protein n=1 Tax=Calothrix sp. NIES-2100 TaxID=1954172 RepID=UPI000B617C58|nr:beta-L-arabinobiosidase [Calothrix sp. NIES-2100]
MVKDLEDFSPLRLVHIFDDRVNGAKPLKPKGLAYSRKAKRFFAVENNEIIAINSQQEQDPKLSTKNISPEFLDNSLIVNDEKNQRLLILNPKKQLIAIATNPDGSLNTAQRSTVDVNKWGLDKILDITIDPDTGRIFLLQKNSITSILPDAQGNFNKAGLVQVALLPDIVHAKRIAFDSSTGNLHVLSFPKEQKLYELDQKGQLLAIRDASELVLKDPNNLVFAPSSDTTDTSNKQSLYVADPTGAGITELSLAAAATAPASVTQAFLVRTTDTSVYSPNSSPDPSGITYLPSSNTLFIVDGEVEEPTNIFYSGSNVFEVNLDGTQVRAGNVETYTKEPTGVSFNPNTGNIFVSDDDARRIYEIAPGADGKFGTGDDVKVGQINTGTFGSTDSEDVVYVNDLSRGIKALFIGGGINAEVYRINAGADGKFGTADDVISSFDTAIMGLIDVEGIAYNQNNGHLYALSGNPNGELFEMTVGGTLVQKIDISAAGSLNAAGLVFAPASKVPGTTNLYVVARGVDNDTDPNENDGKLYEFTLTNAAPTVDAGVNQIVAVNHVDLDGTVVDDGLPNPPGAITNSTWSKLGGPVTGTVTFIPNAIDTTATFSAPGTYILRLTAEDGELTSHDDVFVSYNSTFYVSTIDSGNVSGVGSYGDEDILAYNPNNGTWSMLFDGSDVGLGGTSVDIDAFHIVKNTDGIITSILFSVDYSSSLTSFTLPGGVVIDASDIVRFTPTSLGINTAGTYEVYFDGSDVGLDTSNEDIDAFGILPDNRLLISTSGSPSVPGVNSSIVNGSDEDLLVFTGTTGNNTIGTWAQYFDGSDLALNTSGDEDVNATWVDNGGNIYLSTIRAYSATGVTGTVSGDGNSIFTFIPNSTGSNTSGSLLQFWDGSAAGLNATNSIDGFAIG